MAFAVPSWADSWECRQRREALVAPPYYIDQETMDASFKVQVGSSEVRLSLDDEQVFQCETETCRERLSAMDFLLKGESSDANFILSAVRANVGFRGAYSVTSKPSVGETMIQMGVCSKAASV